MSSVVQQNESMHSSGFEGCGVKRVCQSDNQQANNEESNTSSVSEVKNSETPQERVRRLRGGLYGDFPDLPGITFGAVDRENVIPGKVGIYIGGSKALIAVRNHSDTEILVTMFHESLHVDEALNSAADSLGAYLLYRLYNGGHNNTTNIYDQQYREYLLELDGVKPDLNQLPWRQQNED